MKKKIGIEQLPLTFRAGDTGTIAFDVTEEERKTQKIRLMLRGEPVTDACVLSEWGSGLFVRMIDDALSTTAHHSQYSLRFPATGEKAPRRAWYKLLCNPMTYPGGLGIPEGIPESGEYLFSFFAKGEEFDPIGNAEVRMELYRKKEGKFPQDISGDADEIIRFPLQAGNYSFTKTERTINLKETAAVLFCLEVGESRGCIWLEDVRLCGKTDLSLLPSFHPTSPYGETLNWYGENLAEHQRADFLVRLNGGIAKKQTLFTYIYRNGATELELPSPLRSGRNELSLTYVPDYFSPVPYTVKEIALLEEKKTPFRLLNRPQTAVIGKSLEIAVSVENAPVTLRISSSDDAVLPVQSSVSFSSAGLHVLHFTVRGRGEQIRLSASDGSYTDSFFLSRTVAKEADGILCGTGDAIYIAQEEDSMREYLKWYLENECGNFVTFRPVYHWSGTRSLQKEVWKTVVPFLNEMKMPYQVLFDERELEGLNANPTKEELGGDFFLGFQGHEIDGVYDYWGNDMWGEQGVFYRELRTRLLEHPDVSYREPVVYSQGKTFVYRDDGKCETMAEASEQFLKNLKEAVRGLTKHTGVTLQFRSFLQAGIEVPGAELMYSNHEILLSALRGTAFAYGKSTTASHHALQWYSYPLGYRGFYDRYRISLYLSYMHGVKQINTEEGLWWMEGRFESHDRFSEVPSKCREIETAFLHFISCHSRRGEAVHRHGILQGNCDGYNSFNRENAWHSARPDWHWGKAEDSWDLLKLYYPHAALVHPSGSKTGYLEKDPGWFSATPYGLCEILPAEKAEVYKDYPYLAFLGYNLANEDQLKSLISYVKNGGELLLTWAHLTDDSRHPNPENPRIGTSLVSGYEALTGCRVSVIQQENFKFADLEILDPTIQIEGKVVRRSFGKGTLHLVNSFDYPGEESIKDIYRSELQALAEKVEGKQLFHVDIGSSPVEYAVYELPNGGFQIYFLHLGWDLERESVPVRVSMLGKTYELPVSKEHLGILTLFDFAGFYTCDESTEILSCHNEEAGLNVRMQGEENAEFLFLNFSDSAKDSTAQKISVPLFNGEKTLHFDRKDN